MTTHLPCLCLCYPPPDTGSFFFLVTFQCEAIFLEFIYENYTLYFNVFGAIEVFPVM